jgi:hypothetical protein
MVCSNCNTQNFRDHKFCGECGRPLPRAAEPWDQTRMDGYVALNGGHAQDTQVQALLEQAFLAFEAGQLADARLACQSVLALRGESSAAHSLLGLIYEKEGRRADAIREFEIVLQLNPDSDADRAHLYRLQDGAPRRASMVAEWMQGRRRPVFAAAITAGVVMLGGLWIAAGTLRPEQRPTGRVAPSDFRVLRGAPGAVTPAAGSVRLPPPPIARATTAAAWPTAMNSASGYPAAPSGFGGIPPGTGMNARMQSLAPRLFGQQPAARPSLPPRFTSPRYTSLAPAPVRVPGYAVVPREPVARPSSVPELPDARGNDGAPPDVGSAEPVAMPPVAPAAPPAVEREEPAEGESYIRIRPLGNDASPGAGSTPTAPMRASAALRPAPAAPVGSGPSLAEARLHQQNGMNHWRQRDFAAAYQEYEFAARLYGMIAERGGAESASAREGLRGSEQGMRASGGARE